MEPQGGDAKPKGHLPVRPQWLARYEEPILQPELPIVDPHHHLWDHPGNRYLLDELLADLGSGHNIQATVYVECSTAYLTDGDALMRPLGEVGFVDGVARKAMDALQGRCRVAAGMVAYADLLAGDRVAPVLEALVAAGDRRVRSVRNIAAWHRDPAARGSIANPPPGLLSDAQFRRGFAHLAPAGLSFDAWLYHTQLDELIALARAFPDTAIVLNHMGGPIGIGPYAGKRDEVFADWQASLRVLSTCPNVHVKIGGFGMRLFGFDFHEQDDPPASAQLAEAWRPYAETTLEAFGSQRCMYESNFPVDKAMASYAMVWNAFKRLAAGYSDAERADLFSETAVRVYRLQKCRQDVDFQEIGA
jgi:predicted TIM-barrel fold metal-dependent hydrolase